MGLAPAALLPLLRPFHLHQAATSWSTIHRAGPGERRPLGTAAARHRGHQGADKREDRVSKTWKMCFLCQSLSNTSPCEKDGL